MGSYHKLAERCQVKVQKPTVNKKWKRNGLEYASNMTDLKKSNRGPLLAWLAHVAWNEPCCVQHLRESVGVGVSK